jgi:hypothetical protein
MRNIPIIPHIIALTASLLLLNLIAITTAQSETVFITSLHNLDYARSACELVMTRAPEAQETIREFEKYRSGRPDGWVYNVINGTNECKSVRDPRELGRRLENELADALAVNTRCRGVTVMRDPHPDYDPSWLEVHQKNQKIKNQSDYWNLHLDYNPGHKTYAWALFPDKAGGDPAEPFVSGEGDTSKVADQICTVVTRQGATIR